MNELIGFFERVSVFFAAIFNLILVGVFVLVTFHSVGRAEFYFEMLKPFPVLSSAGVVNYFEEGSVLQKYLHASLFWVFVVIAFGSGWMSLLGLRWVYFTALRSLQFVRSQRLKG